MLTVEPRRDAVGRRAHQHSDPGPVHPLDHRVHPRELEAPLLRLPQAPARLTHPYDVDACGLHHLHVLIEPLVWHVLVIVGDAVQDRVDLRGRL